MLLTLIFGAIIHLTIQFYYWRKAGGHGKPVFSLGGSTFACRAGFESYNRATWKLIPSYAARRGATWNSFGIRDGNALAVGFESQKADWHFVFFIPLPN